LSRTVTATARQAVYDAETSEAFLILLTLTHADLAGPIRVVNNAVDVVSGGDTFLAFPFRIRLPSDTDERPPRATLQIDNVDRQIVTAIRTVTGAIGVLMEVVLASDPDTVEASFPDFTLRQVTYDALVVQGELSLEPVVLEPFPAQRFTPSAFPGLF
jgi:hypothetical protein